MRDVKAQIRSLDDALYFAGKRVPKGIMLRFTGGSGAGHTERRNREAFEEIEFLPRGAAAAPQRVLKTTVLGHEIEMPVYLSSVGGLRAGHAEGELAAARAAGKTGTLHWVSGVSSTSIEEIVAHATGPVFLQLYYVHGKTDKTAAIIERSKAAGVAALVLLADSPTFAGADVLVTQRAFAPTSRNLHEALRFIPQMLTKPAWTWDYLRDGMPELKAAMAEGPDGRILTLDQATRAHFVAPTNWADLPWIREHWDGPIVMKGLVTAECARRAVDEGLDAIVVSNHGGRALDGTVPTIEALPAIVEAVGDQIEVLMDGGVTRGADVVKAVALGARAVGIGRAYVYPLLAAGEEGITHMLGLLRQQIDQTLLWLGASSIHELDRSLLRMPGHSIGEQVRQPGPRR
jgi:isopentenyl diphosphate isomerase/L-lactate dehydrogenase-like FMN-dependent dehydrogenase